MSAQKVKPTIRLDIFIKKEKGYFSAHCLQFDLVVTEDTLEAVQKAIADVCIAHVENSIVNGNLDYLFSPAPKEVWTEYFSSMNDKNCQVKQDNLPVSEGKGASFNFQEVACYA